MIDIRFNRTESLSLLVVRFVASIEACNHIFEKVEREKTRCDALFKSTTDLFNVDLQCPYRSLVLYQKKVTLDYTLHVYQVKRYL